MIDTNKPISKVMYGDEEIPIVGGGSSIEEITMTSDFTTANDVEPFLKAMFPEDRWFVEKVGLSASSPQYSFAGALLWKNDFIFRKTSPPKSLFIGTVSGTYACDLKTGDTLKIQKLFDEE